MLDGRTSDAVMRSQFPDGCVSGDRYAIAVALVGGTIVIDQQRYQCNGAGAPWCSI